MKVYTYFSQVDSMNDPDLLVLWEESWTKYGWETVVLTKQDAINADFEMYQRYLKSPLLNSLSSLPKDYTLACILRWVAMTAINEYALHVDWDVICTGFVPDMVPKLNIPVYYAINCPCAVSANGKGWKLIAAALEMSPFTPNFKAEDLAKDACDQYALTIQPREWAYSDPNNSCKNHDDENLESAGMIHFPNHHRNTITPYPRSNFIRKYFELPEKKREIDRSKLIL